MFLELIEWERERERKKILNKLIEITRMACTSLDTIPFTFPYWLMQYDVTDLWTLCITPCVVVVSMCEIEQLKYAKYSNCSIRWRVLKTELFTKVEKKTKTKRISQPISMQSKLWSSRKMCHLGETYMVLNIYIL